MLAILCIEGREMLSSLLTLYGGIIFIQEEARLVILNIIFFSVIMFVNFRFIILWVYCAATVYKRKRHAAFISSWIKKVFCLEVTEVSSLVLIYSNFNFIVG